jgi:TonB family protein
MKARTIVLTLILMAGVCPGVVAQKCTEKLPDVVGIGPFTNRRTPKIKRKPQPEYTEEARRNNVTGFVLLRGTFHSSGKVQDVCWVKDLPYGLTENAIKAAYKIEFEPIVKEGKPVSVRIFIGYDFNLY